jgi:hypothetical protein
MAESIEFIKKRAIATLAVAKTLAPSWEWQEKTYADYEAQHKALADQEGAANEAEVDMVTARTTWDGQLETLHRRTMQGIAMAKTHFRNDALKLALVQNLEARGDSRTTILKEALDWEKAWKKTDPTWSPMPANTFATFGPLRELCAENLQHAYTEKLTDARSAANCLSQMGRALEDVNEAWYADATRVFPAGTPEGDIIRSQIPTTYAPGPDKGTPPPAPPAP